MDSESKKAESGEASIVELHSIPANINFSGSQDGIGRYFYRQIERVGLLTASLRGRPLNGKQLQMPDGYSVNLVSKTDGGTSLQLSSTENGSCIQTDKLTLWNYDKLVDRSSEPMWKALQFVDMASTLHAQAESEQE